MSRCYSLRLLPTQSPQLQPSRVRDSACVDGGGSINFTVHRTGVLRTVLSVGAPPGAWLAVMEERMERLYLGIIGDC